MRNLGNEIKVVDRCTISDRERSAAEGMVPAMHSASRESDAMHQL
jgi:hypothetical protein